jgi:hypothetical protein
MKVYRELLIVVIFLPLGFCLTYFALPKHGEIVYNCSMAEISPDYPVEVKEQCRKLNMEKIK